MSALHNGPAIKHSECEPISVPLFKPQSVTLLKPISAPIASAHCCAHLGSVLVTPRQTGPGILCHCRGDVFLLKYQERVPLHLLWVHLPSNCRANK